MSFSNWKVVLSVGLLFSVVFFYSQRATQAQITLTFSEASGANLKGTAVNWVLRWNSPYLVHGEYISIVEGRNSYKISLSEHFQDVGLHLKAGAIWVNVLNSDGEAVSGILISWTTPTSSGSEVTSVDGPILIPID